MAKKKPPAIVIGTFTDAARQVWSANSRAFATAQDAVAYLGTRDAYYDDLAYELKVKKEDVPAALEQMDKRVNSADFTLVVTAVLIQREVGGNLAQILDTKVDEITSLC